MTALPFYKECSIFSEGSIHRFQRAAGAFDKALDGLFLIVLLLDCDAEIAAGGRVKGQFEHLVVHAAHDKLGEDGHAQLMLHHWDKGGVVKVDALDILHKAVTGKAYDIIFGEPEEDVAETKSKKEEAAA